METDPLLWPTKSRPSRPSKNEENPSNHKDEEEHEGATGTTMAFTNDISCDVLTLELDREEEQLFATLCQAAKVMEDQYNEEVLTSMEVEDGRSRDDDDDDGRAMGENEGSSGSEKKPIIVRVAGGWVRDKILGLSTHDVDIALDTCTGVEFATMVQKIILTTTTSSSSSGGGGSSSSSGGMSRIAVIAANPDQSKHLETATMKIYGIEVDFSNLRSEAYAEDSRIPTIVIGTPLEDSYRRDFTMNALYYNLQTKQIEDWTRRGLQDLLETKVVVTPLDAYQTFSDDPLRVLRAIRFSVRYSMRLSDDVQIAAKNSNIHTQLHRKVSRERVGKEMEGMLSGRHANPYNALTTLCELGLMKSVFCLPTTTTSSTPLLHGTIGQKGLVPVDCSSHDLNDLQEVAWFEAKECLTTLQAILNDNNIDHHHHMVGSSDDIDGSTSSSSSSSSSPIDHRLVYLATTLLAFRHLQYEDEKRKLKSVIEYVMRESIRFSNKDCQSMVCIFTNLEDMIDLLQVTITTIEEGTPEIRLQAGKILRATKELWTTLLLLATVVLIRRKPETATTKTSTTRTSGWVVTYQTWYQRIVNDLKLEGCWRLKPLMNGKELMQCLGLNKGPQVGLYNQEQIHWMLMNPHGTLDECKTYLKTFQQRNQSEQ